MRIEVASIDGVEAAIACGSFELRSRFQAGRPVRAEVLVERRSSLMSAFTKLYGRRLRQVRVRRISAIFVTRARTVVRRPNANSSRRHSDWRLGFNETRILASTRPSSGAILLSVTAASAARATAVQSLMN